MRLPFISRFTDTQLEEMLKDSHSMWEFAQKVGYTNKSSAVYRSIKKQLSERGFNLANYPALAKRLGSTTPLQQSEIFSLNRRVDVRMLRKRLIDAGLPHECSSCGISEWLGKEITLQVDHVNGVNSDNRVENLRFLCPNCHTQTSTWGAKKRPVTQKV
jgi:5-methylcytosine-specific restriction endonuclease McrA